MLRIVRDKVFPFLKQLPTNGNTFPKAMQDAVFIIPKPSLLDSAVQIIDTLPINDENPDVQGDLYEYLLNELNLSGKNGQFRTSRHIIQTMVELVDPKLKERICDPAAGTAGFLVAAYLWILFQNTSPDIHKMKEGKHKGDLIRTEDEQYLDGDCFIGYDFDTTMVRLGLMNMMLHGIKHPQFEYKDTLSKSFSPNTKFDVILANPPFTGSIDKSDINTELLTLPTTKTELLFVELCLEMLDTGGRCAIIVPEGVLFGSTKAHKELRQRLLNENQIEAVISLPAGCFKPYTGVKTSIIYFTKGVEGATNTTDRVWFYEVTGDGFTLDDKRNEDPTNNDLKYVPLAYKQWVQNEEVVWDSSEDKIKAEFRQWTIDRQAIIDNNYNLTAGAYATITQGALDDDPDNWPTNIIGRVRELESGINEQLDVIEKALSEIKNA